VLYPNINHSHKAYALYFVLYFFLCATLMFNVITGACHGDAEFPCFLRHCFLRHTCHNFARTVTGVIIDAYAAALALARSKDQAELEQHIEQQKAAPESTKRPRWSCCVCLRATSPPSANRSASPTAREINLVANPGRCRSVLQSTRTLVM